MSSRRVIEAGKPAGAFPVLRQVSAARQVWRWVGGYGFLSIMVVATVVRFYDLTAAAIWGDEGSSLLMSQYSLAGIWFHAAHDVHPPLYFMILHGWIELFGDGIFSIRCLSAVPGIATVALGVWLTRLIASRRAALLAGLLLALLPTAVRYSQEVRMYSLLGLWLLGATLALVYWIKYPNRTRYLLGYVLLMTAAFYTHYFTALCVLAHWSYLLVLRWQPTSPMRYVNRPAWWLANAAIVLLYLPWVPGLVDLVRHVDELKANGDVGWELPVTFDALPSMIWSFLLQDDGEALPWPVFAALPLLLLGVVGWAVVTDRSHYRWSTLLAIYAVLPLLTVFGVSFISPVFIERYLTAYAVALPLLIALACARLYRHVRWLALTVLVLFGGVELAGLNNNSTVDVKDQVNVMVDYVNQHYVPGDRIVISDLLWYLSYVYYNRTDAQPLLYTPPSAEGGSSRPNAYGFGTLVEAQAPEIYLDSLTTLARGTGRVWLISTYDQPDEFAPLPAGWQVLGETAAGNARARLFLMGKARPNAS
ncbi:glycosyltransferase family 39 protein [Pseudomonas purpurea]|uniref:glycosyltransferase family 39 protein n=1 Tax=Pseudomonas purpurea TaxID=3136737 RepID=UPI0032650BFC